MANLTYASYLALDQLLSLQRPRSKAPEHDETMFIIVHQIGELWFKLILHEAEQLRAAFRTADPFAALPTFKRIVTIMKGLIVQFDVLETMSPVSFMAFRPDLENASGFQSLQFREMELAFGQRNEHVVERMPEGSEGRRRLEACLQQPNVWDCFLQFMAARVGPRLGDSEKLDVQAALIATYRSDPALATICEHLIDFDERMQEWRYRHVKLVERTMGTRRGTGGSSGAAYLRSTLFRPLFPDLWSVRAVL